jgi:uncharacterized protein
MMAFSLLFRRVAVLPIRVYQWTLSPLLPRACRFAPSCSEYAAEAILTHGPFTGLRLALHRLARCHPWGGHGYDPVPPAASQAPLARAHHDAICRAPSRAPSPGAHLARPGTR